MAALIQRRKRIDASFDLTPLIDVVFQLLIFLMISSQFKKPEAVVELPQTPGAATIREDKPNTLEIAIDADEAILIDNQPIKRDAFEMIIAERVTGGIERVEIRGDRDSSFGLFVEIMDEARSAGVQSIGIVKRVQPDEAVPSDTP